MSWGVSGKEHSRSQLGGLDSEVDLRSSYREILSQGGRSTAAPSEWTASGGSALSRGPPELLSQGLRLLRGLVLFSASAAGSVIAALGVGLLAYLLLSRALTPAQQLHTRTLFLDYSKTDLVAQAAFLPTGDLGDGVMVPRGLPPGTRFLPPGQRVDVWVDLQLPPSSANCRGGMAQVVAELVTLDGTTLARTSRPLLLRSNGWDLWSLATAPLRWVGLVTGARRVRVPLFQGYREQEKAPFTVFQVAIKTRDPSWAPEVLRAEVGVRLRLGLLRRILYTLRPGTLLMLLLGAGALASLVGGSTAAAVFFALWLYTLWGPAGAAGSAQEIQAGGGEEGEGGSSALSDAEGDERGSVSGFSEVESVGASRRASREEMAEGPRRFRPGGEGLGGADEDEEWQDVAPESSAAAASKPAIVGAGKAPAPSAAASADDTAFLGSGPGGGWGEGNAGLTRRRPPAGAGKRLPSTI